MRKILLFISALAFVSPAVAADFGPQPGGYRTSKVSGSPFRKGLVASASNFFGPINSDGTRADFMPLMAGYGTARGALVVESATGEIAMTAASRNTDASSTGAAPIGAAIFNFNFRTGTGNTMNGWAIYAETRHLQNAGNAFGMELDVTEFGTANQIQPYNVYGNQQNSVGIWLVSGGGCISGAPCWNGTSQTGVANDATAAMMIGRNSAKWSKGIVFASDGLTGCTGTSGSCTAVTMGRYAGVTWFDDGGAERVRLSSSIASGTGTSINVDYNQFGVLSNVPAKDGGYTVAGLPACSVAGLRTIVSDAANGFTYGGTPAGGGPNTVGVICNGGTASWKYD